MNEFDVAEMVCQEISYQCDLSVAVELVQRVPAG